MTILGNEVDFDLQSHYNNKNVPFSTKLTAYKEAEKYDLFSVKATLKKKKLERRHVIISKLTI